MSTNEKITLTERFWSKVHISDTHSYNGTPCLEWTAQIDGGGYGRFWLNGKKQYAHRVSYEDKYGKIPDGLVINHMCRNRCCINREEHLEVVTQKVNAEKGLTGLHQRIKTHCPQGHEYSKENMYIHSDGWRQCKICVRIRSIQSYQRKKLEMIN